MKKRIALLCAALMLLTLAACDNGSNTPDQTVPEATKADAPAGTDGATPGETPTEAPADAGGWPSAAIAGYTEGKVEIPAFTGACSGFDVYDSGSSVNITCTDAETADIKAYVESLQSLGFKDGLFWLSDTAYVKVSYASDMITVARKDEAGKWPYNQIRADLGYAADDIYGVSDYTFTYDKASHTVTCANADEDLLQKVVDSFDGSSNWDATDEENVFELYKREDSYPTIRAAIALNGSTLTVVFTVS